MEGGRKWSGVGLVIVALAAVLAGYKYLQFRANEQAIAAAPEPVEVVQLARATILPFAPDERAVGTIVATQTVELRNELAGTLSHVGFRSGEIVPAGTVLARFDSSEERARLAAQNARAMVAAKNLDRAQELVKRGFITQAQVDLLLAESRAASAEAAAIRAVIAKKEIRAPFTGRAGIHDLHAGQYLDEGSLITAMQGVAPERYVDFTLPAASLTHLALGDVVKVSGTGLDATGVPARIVARDSGMTMDKLVKYRATFGASPDLLLPGGFVDVSVPEENPRPTVFVPRSAVIERPHVSYVFLLVPDKAGQFRARQTVIRLGPVVGEKVAVASGLKGGERVAGEGAFKLRDGMLVQPMQGR